MNLRREIAEDLHRRLPGCTLGWKSGHASLQVGGKVFAFTRPDESAAVKLPAERAAALIEGGEIHYLKMGQRTMREWVVIPGIAAPENMSLLREAMNYVASLPKTAKKKTVKAGAKTKAGTKRQTR